MCYKYLSKHFVHNAFVLLPLFGIKICYESLVKKVGTNNDKSNKGNKGNTKLNPLTKIVMLHSSIFSKSIAKSYESCCKLAIAIYAIALSIKLSHAHD